MKQLAARSHDPDTWSSYMQMASGWRFAGLTAALQELISLLDDLDI